MGWWGLGRSWRNLRGAPGRVPGVGGSGGSKGAPGGHPGALGVPWGTLMMMTSAPKRPPRSRDELIRHAGAQPAQPRTRERAGLQ